MPDTVSEAANKLHQNSNHMTDTHIQAMLRVLSEAAHRARLSRKPVIAAYSMPMTSTDPLNLYADAKTTAASHAWYWEQPSRSVALAARGVVAEWAPEAGGPREAITAWRELLADAVIAQDSRVSDDACFPLAFSGFAFDERAQRTSLWEGFPAAALVLPEVVLCRDAAGTRLTLIARVSDESDVEQHGACWRDRIADVLDTRSGVLTPPHEARKLQSREPVAPLKWEWMVAAAARDIRHGELGKVVLARAVEVDAAQAYGGIEALHQLRSTYPTATIFAVRRGERTFLGATPERLARVRHGYLETIALAGTSPRGATSNDDALAAETLRRSEKNAGEHRVVVSTISDALAPLCATLVVEPSPHIRTLPNVLHLETSISGELFPQRTLLDVVAALHPTPAVAGFPRDTALAYLREHERLDRGWYAGTLGWIDATGDGEFAVALRSALIEGPTATLFAGCGIVADSQPESEYAESNLKLRVMREALGLAGGGE